MKKSELQQLIREEIQKALEIQTEELSKDKIKDKISKLKKGDKVSVDGFTQEVVGNNGYVITLKNAKTGKEITKNYNQMIKQAFLRENEAEAEVDYEVYYMYRERGNNEEETETPINVKASNKEEAVKKAKEKLKADKPSRWKARIDSSFEAFEKKKN